MNKNEEKQTKREKFKELWGNTRTRAIIKLGMWGAFFGILFIISLIFSLVGSYKNSNFKDDNQDAIKEENEKVEVNVVGILQKLLNNSYSYKYTIINGDISYSYSGTKDENSNIGYFENQDGITKYEVENDEYYKIINEEKIIDENLINDQDKNIIGLKDMIIRIKSFEEVNKALVNGNLYTYDLSYETNKYVVNITIDDSNISKIEVNYNDINYILEYKNIIESNVNQNS